jgi:hypothetical protein
MRSDPLDVPTALEIGRGTLRKMRQNLGWAIGYNALALPIAAGVFEPAFGLVLRPEIAALSMSGSSLIVAVNALTLKRLPLPRRSRRTAPVVPSPLVRSRPPHSSFVMHPAVMDKQRTRQRPNAGVGSPADGHRRAKRQHPRQAGDSPVVQADTAARYLAT